MFENVAKEIMKMENYEITVEIGGHARDREKDIKKACMVEWNFRKDDFEHVPSTYGRKRLLQASALGSIEGEENIGEVVARIERAVWRENGRICHVQCHVLKMGEVNGHPALTPCEEVESLVA